MANKFEIGLLIFINRSILQSIWILQDRFVIIQVAKSFFGAVRKQRILNCLILRV